MMLHAEGIRPLFRVTVALVSASVPGLSATAFGPCDPLKWGEFPFRPEPEGSALQERSGAQGHFVNPTG